MREGKEGGGREEEGEGIENGGREEGGRGEVEKQKSEELVLNNGHLCLTVLLEFYIPSLHLL